MDSRLLVTCLLAFSIEMCYSQLLESDNKNKKGVEFQKDLSWEEIKAKAKEEHKFIFVDLYATWCAPCKQMDRIVYTDNELGNFLNKHFISVKVQIDSSKDDDNYIRTWYPEAGAMMDTYKITGLPSYLFFSPDGNIVHRQKGGRNVKDFLAIVKDALNIDRQYYSLVAKYRNGRKDYSSIPYMARLARSISEKDFSDSLARDYIENIMNDSEEENWMNKANLQFIGAFEDVLSSRDYVFNVFYHQSGKIDSIVGDVQYSQRVLEYTITKEEITPKLKQMKTGDPVWAEMMRTIAKKYGKSLAESSVLESKLKWYNQRKDWSNVIKYNIEKVEKYGVDTSTMGRILLNNMIYEVIFKHSTDKKSLKWAIGRMKIIVKADSTDALNMDTYANLLYKSGRKSEGLQWERKAVGLEPNNQDLQTALRKMQKGSPTWD